MELLEVILKEPSDHVDPFSKLIFSWAYWFLFGEYLSLITSEQTDKFNQEIVINVFSFTVSNNDDAFLRVIKYILKQTYSLYDVGRQLLKVHDPVAMNEKVHRKSNG